MLGGQSVSQSVSQSVEVVRDCAGAATDLVGLPGVWAAVKYMMAMGPSHLDLLHHHARCAPAPAPAPPGLLPFQTSPSCR